MIFCSPGAKCSVYNADKVYLGVRVKMPVRDLLKNIRKARGWIPKVIARSLKCQSSVLLQCKHLVFQKYLNK